MIKTKLYEDIKANLADGFATLLIGPTGSTKTASALMAMRDMVESDHLDEVVVISVSPGLEDIDLITKFVPAADGIRPVRGPLRRAFDMAASGKRVGVLIDEINRGEHTSTNIILTAIDRVHGAYMLNDFTAGEQIVAPLENLVVVATANIGNAYTGTSHLDEALMDRFSAVIYVNYDEELEAKLADGYPFVKQVARAVRAAYANGKVSSPFSTRQLVNWVEALKRVGKKPSKKDIRETAQRTWVYRVVGTDGFGMPIGNELELINGILSEAANG